MDRSPLNIAHQRHGPVGARIVVLAARAGEGTQHAHERRLSGVRASTTVVPSDVDRLAEGEAVLLRRAPRPGLAAAPRTGGHRGSNDLRGGGGTTAGARQPLLFAREGAAALTARPSSMVAPSEPVTRPLPTHQKLTARSVVEEGTSRRRRSPPRPPPARRVGAAAQRSRHVTAKRRQTARRSWSSRHVRRRKRYGALGSGVGDKGPSRPGLNRWSVARTRRAQPQRRRQRFATHARD